MNFVSIGDQVNETLKTLAQNDKLASGKPTFRKMDSQSNSRPLELFLPNIIPMLLQLLSESLAPCFLKSTGFSKKSVSIHDKGRSNTNRPRTFTSSDYKTDVSQLPGIREALNLTQLEVAMGYLKTDPAVKQRLVESVIESYQQLTGRTWREMTYPEKDALEKLRAWARQ